MSFLSGSDSTSIPKTGGDFTGRVTWQFGANIASASTVTLGTDGNAFHITGTANISDFTAITGSGPFFLVTDGALTFTHATGVLETNTGADITSAAGDRFRLDQDSDGTTWLLTQLGAGGAGVFTKSFTSAEQTITSGGSLTLAHSLGASPSLIQTRLICKTAEGGYSIGDEVIVPIFEHVVTTSNFQYGVSIVPDSTNLNIRYSNSVQLYIIPNKSTGTSFGITNANWKLVVRAWA